MSKRSVAKDTMLHYFTVLFDKAGVKYTGDDIYEIWDMVDYMIDAAKEELREELEHEAEVKKKVQDAKDKADIVWTLE